MRLEQTTNGRHDRTGNRVRATRALPELALERQLGPPLLRVVS